MISVIVPVYNAEKTLIQCIDSILSQRYKDFELLLINDGSKDKSGKICDDYALKDNRVRVFHQPNRGVSAARNLGLENMKGEFVTFCDSDDWVEDTWLSDYIDNYNGEDVLYQNARWWKGDEILLDRKVSLSPALSTFEKIKSLYLTNTLFYIWSALWKTSIIKANLLKFPNVKLWEDGIWASYYCTHINNIDIIPNEKCHNYNYNYRFPTETRDYQKINVEKTLALFMNMDSFDTLCKSFHKEHEFSSFSKKITPILYHDLFLIYKNNTLEQKEKLDILKIYSQKKKRLFLDSKDSYIFKILHLFLFKNYRISDLVYKIILKIKYNNR